MSKFEVYGGEVEFSGQWSQAIDSAEIQAGDLGYSISVWINPSRIQGSKTVTILQRGRRNTCQPLIYLQGRSVEVKFDTQRLGQETLFSNSQIQPKKWTNLVFVVKQEMIIQAALYINGHLDSQVSIRDTLIQSNSYFLIGKDPQNFGFIGSIAEPIFFSYPITQRQVLVLANLQEAEPQILSKTQTQQNSQTLINITSQPELAWSTKHKSIKKSMKKSMRKSLSTQKKRTVSQRLLELATSPYASLKPKKQIEPELEPQQIMYCKNWGCLNKKFQLAKNHKKACRFHPGRWEFGSIHSLWPEHWTCCRGEWTSPGCKRDFHKALPYVRFPRQCVNRGQVNPKTYQLDSFCGKGFPDPQTCGLKYTPDPQQCKYHSGYKVVTQQDLIVWTCCEVVLEPGEPDLSFCVASNHRYAEYPDEQSKIYFVTRTERNPAIQTRPKTKHFSDTGKISRFHNPDIQPYINPYQRKKQKILLENQPRYCLNWGCEKVYKEADNTDTACRCHPGYWDFGHTGMLKEGQTVILWKPHWRCCRGDWDSQGCTLTRHRGPLLSSMPQRKWKWPDLGAQRYFFKKISFHWRQKLQEENLTRPQVAMKYKRLCKEKGVSKLTPDLLHHLCHQLNLHILCVSEDMSYMFKYQDLVNKMAEQYLENEGYINMKDFLDWWFAPVEVVRPLME